MLQRAASNAYSWWWASHIRTTQSKWLDANLQEMETRVKMMLKLLGEEADTFGKRAEMYYRRRPEVINHVEEVYRAYRALVERYDHLSKELHKANHTIATACPEQVQYALLEQEEDVDFPKAMAPIDPRRIQESTVQEILKRKGQAPSGQINHTRAPHITKWNAQHEISTLQKAILVLQTEKEFVKSSYESGIAKYWEIEKQIADMQDKICRIQNEFDAHASIEDDEARSLMTITALRSCQGTVAKLVKRFEELVSIAAGESEKINHLREKLYAMNNIIDPSKGEPSTTNITVKNRVYPNTQEILELQPIYDKIERFFELNSESIVEEMASKVDELVDKVMNLELKFPKQSAQIKQLKEDNDCLKDRLDDLQDEIALRDDPSDLSEQLKLAEDELNRVRALERSVIEEEVLVSTVFSEVVSCITNTSKAFGSIGPEDMTSLSAAAENDGERTSDDISTSLPGEEFRGLEEPTTDDNLGRDRCRKEDASGVDGHDSLDGTDGIDDCKNSNEENFQSENRLIQKDSPDRRSIQATNNIDRIVTPGKENGFNETYEGKIDCSPSIGTKKYRDMRNDVIDNSAQGESLKGEHPPTVISQTHLPHSESIDTLTNKCDSDEKGSSVVVTVNSFGGSNGIQGLRIGGDENSISGNSLIQEGLGDGKLLKTPGHDNLFASANLYSLKDGNTSEKISLPEASNRCFSDADMGLDLCHTDEAIAVEEWPKQDGQLIAPETIKSSNRGSMVDSSKEGGRTSLEHMNSIQDLKTSELVDARSSRAYQQVPEITTKSESIASYIPHGEQEKRNLDGKELIRQASTLSRPGSMSLRVNSSLVAERDAPSWQEFLLNGIEGREAIFLDDYTLILHSYPAEMKLRELRTELDVWFEQNALLDQDLQLKTTSLCRLQEEIAEALHTSPETGGGRFTPYEAAKFQGEVLNMQQSSAKIERELQAALKHMRELEGKVNDGLQKLCKSFDHLSCRRSSLAEAESSSNHSQFKHFPTRTRVPLQNFLFGAKQKKKSI